MLAFGLSRKLCNDFLKKQAVIGNLNEGNTLLKITISNKRQTHRALLKEALLYKEGERTSQLLSLGGWRLFKKSFPCFYFYSKMQSFFIRPSYDTTLFNEVIFILGCWKHVFVFRFSQSNTSCWWTTSRKWLWSELEDAALHHLSQSRQIAHWSVTQPVLYLALENWTVPFLSKYTSGNSHATPCTVGTWLQHSVSNSLSTGWL